MARAGMTRWRTRNCALVNDGCDEVQKSLDLLDRVLSEFDDCDNGSPEVERTQLTLINDDVKDDRVGVASLKSYRTPEGESPSSGLGGHQSEDDGYMSMNGRKARLLLGSSASSSNDFTNGGNGDNDGVCTPETPPLVCEKRSKIHANGDFPPPPEEAERIISTLLPRVSPCSSSQRSSKNCKEFFRKIALSFEERAQRDVYDKSVTIATQTTLPKTKYQRPYGWQKEMRTNHNIPSSAVNNAQRSCIKYGSLPNDGVHYDDNHRGGSLLHFHGSQVMLSRAVIAALDRHREVHRCEDNEKNVTLNTVQEFADDDPANFSDDSLEDMPPPPPPTQPPSEVNKRASIAWEVTLKSSDADLQMLPGSTKVVGRRRKKSTDYSSTSSLTTLNVYDDWPEPPNETDDSFNGLTSDTNAHRILNDHYDVFETLYSRKQSFNGGTYVIRKGNKKDRKQLFCELRTPTTESRSQKLSPGCNEGTDLKRCSSTFDNIKTMLREGLVEGLDDSPPDFQAPRPPKMTRGESLPNIVGENSYDEESRTKFIDNANESISCLEQLLENESSKFTNGVPESSYVSKCVSTEWDKFDYIEKQSVAVQVSADFTLLNKEIIEQSTSCQTDNEELNYCVSKAIDTAENITSTGTFKRERKAVEVESVDQVKSILRDKTEIKSEKLKIGKQEEQLDRWTSGNATEVKMVPVKKVMNVCNGLDKPCGDFRVNVEILQHEFGPLPPSPVEEIDDEYSDVLQSVPTNRKSDSLSNDCMYRRNNRLSGSGSIRSNRIEVMSSQRDPNFSLKTRSVDAGFSRNHRPHFLSSRKEIPVERRTLPTDLPGTSHRRPFQKRGSQSPKDENSHVSCSLPETPIFTRGCDIPRTPLRNNTGNDNSVRTTPRLNGIQTSRYLTRDSGAGHGTCLGDAMAGAELLRLTGPGRGWYPRHRQPRPASVEHLDRLTPQCLSPSVPAAGVWESQESRKPLTLPPNLSPKFFQRSPREALRRVTSLLIRKGGTTKDTKAKDVLASSVIGPHGEFGESARQQKRGFFRGFWKRSRHYSLDQQQ